ncbi:hypothetical protein F528_1311 [Neisseria meningitidis 992008]|uniref:Uncharacterized protein n=1 Tax=Neisseria lactamica (strain 020-06) TaxID=489653 RepID=E4ZCE7_NEIL0|nr:hypothetical protein F528_1311 [Neisseria meningitidis 992008]CBN87026.1 hypothetical protein NLA_7910 [Neisseria lactamica 020-06]
MPSERQAHRAIRFYCKRMKSSKYPNTVKQIYMPRPFRMI